VIESIPTEHFEDVTYRYLQEDRTRETLREMELDTDGVHEMAAAAGMLDSTAAHGLILDTAFVTRAGPPAKQSRFSDGTIRVFYSALEPQTAAQEAFEWNMNLVVSGAPGPREAFFMLTAWQFAGEIKDLRPHRAVMLFLTQRDSASTAKCNEIGAEAATSNLDGLLSPSVAIKPGTCLPVFQRRALPRLEYQRLEKFTLDPTSGVLGVVPV